MNTEFKYTIVKKQRMNNKLWHRCTVNIVTAFKRKCRNVLFKKYKVVDHQQI